MAKPLPERMRPTTIEQFVGQEQIVGEGSILKKMLESGHITSFILWGPPGVGKTTLARVVALHLKRPFHQISAVHSGVKELREIIEKSGRESLFSKVPPLLFIDEIHRFNKAQQDSLLGAVEEGKIVLVGATTENPSFEVITPLLSRCHIFVLKPLDSKELDILIDRAIKEDILLSSKKIEIEEREALYLHSSGDARKLLNIIDIITSVEWDKEKIVINNNIVTNLLNEHINIYDKGGEYHYDMISAFIKSVRGSDPNGALYWMGRMLNGGEDPLFIARRLIILAAEDIGLANPNGLLLANSAFDAVNKIGMPEARIVLSQAAIYLATSPKSNSAYIAIDAAIEESRKSGNLPVPLHLRNAPTKLMKELKYGEGYKYAHSYPGNFVEESFLPPQLEGAIFYTPGNNRREREIQERLEREWKVYANLSEDKKDLNSKL